MFYINKLSKSSCFYKRKGDNICWYYGSINDEDVFEKGDCAAFIEKEGIVLDHFQSYMIVAVEWTMGHDYFFVLPPFVWINKCFGSEIILCCSLSCNAYKLD